MTDTVPLQSLGELTRKELARIQSVAARAKARGFSHVLIEQPEDWYWGAEGTHNGEVMGSFPIDDVLSYQYGKDYKGD